MEGFWGFEEHGVCPDIVTMAKAAGNGHPLGFVLVQSDIAEDFKTCEVRVPHWCMYVCVYVCKHRFSHVRVPSSPLREAAPSAARSDWQSCKP